MSDAVDTTKIGTTTAAAAVVAPPAETTVWCKEKTEVKHGKTIHTLEKETVGPDQIPMYHREQEEKYIDEDGKEHSKVKIETMPLYD